MMQAKALQQIIAELTQNAELVADETCGFKSSEGDK